MKNLFKVLAVVLCLCFALPCAAEEKINNFEVHFNLMENNSADVEEYITFTAEHNQIEHGLFRILPKAKGQNIHVESLTLDGEKHPYNTEETQNSLTINFGTDDLLEIGEHNYVLTYILSNVMRPTFTHDALLWPVTGGAWNLPIEKTSFYLTLPYEVKPITEKITTYIAVENAKEKIKNFNRLEKNIFTFELQKPLKEGQTFSVYLPVKKGVFKFKWYEIKYMPVFVCLLIIIYYFIIWYLVGRDPEEKLFPTRFSPPKNVSAGFVSYFLNGPFSTKNLATVFASLIVKGKIKITFPKRGAPHCEKIDNPRSVLDEDEIRLLMCLPSEFKLNKSSHTYLEKGLLTINYYYEGKIDNYVINNFVYMLFPIVFFGAIIFYFYMQGVVSEVLFWGIINFLIPLAIGIYTKNIWRIVILVASALILNMIGISTLLSPSVLADPNVIAIIVTCFLTALFEHLVNNLMIDGAVLRDELAAFKRYMTTAEKRRAALSKPSVAGQIFCDYLPYAYAFGMESEWFKKFKNKIDFRLQDTYGPLVSSTALNVGLLFAISAVLQGSTPMVGNIPIPIGKGGLGGGGR
ncbi:MAG: DUF2207 domain-containing protein [Elusimicrobiaceae bacterium]|nr:DUF2207 domain-containing protein [Elusimicrobiaceae bacterium]